MARNIQPILFVLGFVFPFGEQMYTPVADQTHESNAASLDGGIFPAAPIATAIRHDGGSSEHWSS